MTFTNNALRQECQKVEKKEKGNQKLPCIAPHHSNDKHKRCCALTFHNCHMLQIHLIKVPYGQYVAQ